MQDNNLYVIAEMRYEEQNPNANKESLYPFGWESNEDIHLKIEILADAIQNNVLIKDSKLYQEKYLQGFCRVTSINNENK